MIDNTSQNIIFQEDKPAIWVTCLAAYNNGNLHGRWIDATQGIEKIREEIQDILKTSPAPFAEDWAIHDYQNFFGYGVDEYHDIEQLSDVAEMIWNSRMESSQKPMVVTELIYDFGIEGAEEMLSENFIGCFASREDFIYEYVENTGILSDVNETIKQYFDYESFLSDMENNGDIFMIEARWDEIYVFYNR